MWVCVVYADTYLVFSSGTQNNNCIHLGKMHQELMSSSMKSTQNSARHVGDAHEMFPMVMMMMSPKGKRNKRRM